MSIDALIDVNEYASAETLTNLCYKVICENLDIISKKEVHGQRMLRKSLIFPSEICDRIIEFSQKSEAIEDNECFFSIFENVSSTKLKHVKIHNCSLTDSSVLTIAKHKVSEMEFVNCPNLTRLSIEHINSYSENLHCLAFRGSFKIKDETDKLESNYYERGYIFNAPNLRRLTLGHFYIPDYKICLQKLTNLNHLDLSSNHNFTNFNFNSLVPNLVSLVLFNVKLNNDAQAFVENVTQLKRLRHLDISQCNAKNGLFNMPDVILGGLVSGLPELVSLDIGGTNLAGRGVTERPLDKKDEYFEETQLCDIPGLSSRVSNPLQFLGLYGAFHGASRRHDIPAKIIAGDKNEEQILVAARVCMNYKQELLQKVLNDLYHAFRYDQCNRTDQGLCIVLEAMEKHPSEKHIQISGSATIFYIVKSKENHINASMKRRIIGTLLAGMSAHKDEDTMMRNGCLALCQFRIPQDVMWSYESLVRVLLHSVKHSDAESFVQRIGIYLLNSLACQVEGKEKRLLGKLGCVETMLHLVEYRVISGIFDDVLEVAWSTMWNMTDETDINCKRFLNKQGMDLFLKCAKQYPNKEELLRNMMGLLGNVAEVENLRSELMKEQYVTVFSHLLCSNSDGIEVSYNAAGILAHMASDGAEAWTIDSPSRKEVLNLMVEAINRWDLDSERNINYRSFLPLLRLVDIYHTPQCQHWAVWALANLTRVYPYKYCKLVIAEGGIEKLKKILASDLPYVCIKQLANLVIASCSMSDDKLGDTMLQVSDR